MTKYEQVGENLLPAIAYGDAAGLPYEAKLAQPEGSVTQLPQLFHNTYLAIPDARKGQIGLWSDDTHLSLATTVSLVRRGGFDLEDQAKAHVEAYAHVGGHVDDPDFVPAIVTRNKRNGFGPSTVKSIKRLEQGVHPRRSGEPLAAGNGVVMRMAPLVYWLHMNDPEDTGKQNVMDFTRMTHGSPEATVSSLVHNAILSHLLTTDPTDQDFSKKQLFRQAVYLAGQYERMYDPNYTTSSILGAFDDRIMMDPDGINRDDILEVVSEKPGFHVPETLLMAYGSFILEDHFPDCVYRAVELGGDTDSIASIVGAMSVFYHGEIEQPADMENVFAIDRLRRISKQLAEVSAHGLTDEREGL